MAGAEQARRLFAADALGHLVPGLPRAASLGRNDDDAVGGTRAVDRRRRRRLQDLDVLDVVRIDVGQAVDRLVLRRVGRTARARDRRQAAGDRRVRYDDAVDDVERIAGAENRRRAADLDLHAAARNARVLEDRRADDFALEIRLEGFRRSDDELVRRDRRDRRRRVALVDRRRLSGYRHAFQLQDVLFEHEVRGARRRGNQFGLSLEPDGAYENLNVARRYAEPILAAFVRSDTLLRTENTDGGFSDRCPDPLLRYLARDLASLCGDQSRHECE